MAAFVNRETFVAVVREISDTREVEELGCEDCFEQVDRFVSAQLSGMDAARALPLVQEHLEICGECREEFGALLLALRAAGGSASGPDAAALDALLRGVGRLDAGSG